VTFNREFEILLPEIKTRRVRDPINRMRARVETDESLYGDSESVGLRWRLVL